jgi:dihydrolipoamide dehydrogenase
MTVSTVDAVVIGAGPGDYHAAIRLGRLGKSVICIDRNEIGGACKRGHRHRNRRRPDRGESLAAQRKTFAC